MLYGLHRLVLELCQLVQQVRVLRQVTYVLVAFEVLLEISLDAFFFCIKPITFQQYHMKLKEIRVVKAISQCCQNANEVFLNYLR